MNAGVGPFSVTGAYVAILPPDRCTLWNAVGVRLQGGGDFVVFDSPRWRPRTSQLPCTPSRIFAGAAVFSLVYGGALNSDIRFAVNMISRPAYPEVGEECGYRRASKGRLSADLGPCSQCGSPLSAPVGEICAAQIWNGAAWESVAHDARRCRKCRIYFRLNFAWINHTKINKCASLSGNPTIPPDKHTGVRGKLPPTLCA